MVLHYKGGRSHYKVSLGRKPYYFTKENNRTLDIKDQSVINYIFSLPNRQEFEVIENIPVEPAERAEDQRVILPKMFVEDKKNPGRPKKGWK